MKKNGLFFIGLVMGIILVCGIFLSGSLRNARADSTTLNQLADVATQTPTPTTGEDELVPPQPIEGGQLPHNLPTPVPGETLLYFVPSDNDATATVLYLYNTDTVAHIVALRGFSYNGVLVYSLNINVNAGSFLRLASDSIAAAPPPSWATPAPIITNFTDFTYFGSLSLPHGVKAEGYVLFNPGTGVVDPRQDQGAIPLRFSTDPATVLLPTVGNNP
jgi:hypothetical protein